MIKYKRTKNTWADFLSSQVKVGVERNRNQVFVPEWDIWFLSLKFRFRQSRYRISGRKKACNFSFSELFSGNHFHFLYKVHRKKIFLLIFLTVPTGLPVLTVAQRQKQDILSSHKYLVSFPLNPYPNRKVKQMPDIWIIRPLLDAKNLRIYNEDNLI